jgi:hypothetical protein
VFLQIFKSVRFCALVVGRERPIFFSSVNLFEPKILIIRIKSMNELPSPDLYDRVINRINYEHKLLLLKRKLFGYLISFILSFSAFIPLFGRFHQDIIQSALPQFFSLIFTDFSVVISNIGDFFWLILESIPAASMALTTLALTVFAFSLIKVFCFWMEFRDLQHLKIGQCRASL